MKATDLMLGNWVRVYVEDDDPTQCGYVTCKVENLNDFGDIGARGNDYREEDVEPIELTAAILEKNGFVCVDVGDNGPGTPKKYRNRFEKWECKTQWRTYNVFYDRLTNYYSINDYSNSIHGMRYVHELQQAYHRCGIKEEVQI